MLHAVIIKPNPGTDVTRIQAALEPAQSWYRLSPTVWIISTWETAEVWTQRLLHFVNPNGHLLVAKLDPFNRQGYMPRKFWDWFNEHTEIG